jgi:hypothetical protein
MVDNRVMPNAIVATTENLNKLTAFRQTVYHQFGSARDALFELSDAVLLSHHVNSFAELSLCPAFRRRWPSIYEALQDSRPDRSELLDSYVAQMPLNPRPILMGDHTAWPRPAAYTLRERTIEHQPTPIPGARPITVGQGYSTIAWVPEAQGSWALPLLHERIASHEKPVAKAAQQLKQVCGCIPDRCLALLDAEYGCAPFVQQVAGVPCDVLMRLRSNLCLLCAPLPYPGRGRPAVHGRKFKLKDARTWGKPMATLEVTDPDLGSVQMSLWANLHFRKAARRSFWVMRLERLQARGTRRDQRVVWLAWLGQPPPPLAEWWKIYFRRFAGDHWYRFAKQSLHWTLPRLKTPEQAERWSDLMPFLTWQVWLARAVVADRLLPWQKKQMALSPGRVRQSLGSIWMQVGTPAQLPKPRGKSPGWLTGRERQRAQRFPIVKKRCRPN